MSIITLALCGASFLAGLVDSVAGGGGLILLPALLVAGIPPQQALGTNKFASALGTTTALVNFARSKMIYWRIAALGVAAGLVGSYTGSRLVLAIPNEAVGRILVMLLPVGIAATLIPKRNGRDNADFTPVQVYALAPAVCFFVGLYDGFFGPGAGSFYILGLHFFLGMGLPRASALAKVFNLVSNVGALIGFIAAGKVLFLLGLPLAVANIAGGYLGSRLAIRKGEGVVRIFLLISLALLFVTLIWKYFLSA